MSDVSVLELLALVGEQQVRIRVLERQIAELHAQLDEAARETDDEGND